MYKGDLYDALMLLSEGDSAIIKIDADTLMKHSGQPKPPGFKGKYFNYTIKIEKVLPKGKLDDKAFQEKIGQYFKGEADKAKAAEPIKIKKYIADKKPETDHYAIRLELRDYAGRQRPETGNRRYCRG